MNGKIGLPWLEPLAGRLDDMIGRGQLPHALLLHGQQGTGRERLALWLAGRLLNRPELADAKGRGGDDDPDGWLHADLMWLAPPADKQVLPIDQVRAMVAFLQLTAHQGGAKIAVVSPAESLSHQAANSLLKTLEEPPPGSLIILVAAAPGRLPATVLSRCQRLRVATPPADQALAWLQRASHAADWDTALELAGGAPLKALSLAEAGFPAESARLADDLHALQQGRATPVAVSRRWARLPGPECLDWLYRRTAAEIRRLLGVGAESGTGHLQYVTNGLNIDSLFDYLREIEELRRLHGSGLNMELGLARLLQRWYRGLNHDLG